MDFGRVLTAMVTPFDENGQIDRGRVETLVNHLIHTGTQTIVVAGTTGESPVLSHQEKLDLFRMVVEFSKGRARVMAGTGNNSTEQTIALSKEAEQCGVDALLLVAPYYNKPSQEGLYQHFKSVAEAVTLPIMLYNIPSRTSVNIEVATQLRLAEVPNIVSMKESSGDFSQVSQLLANKPDDFTVYCGDDKFLLPMMAIGAHGIVSVAAHIVGPQIRDMIDAFVSGRITEAADLHAKLMPIFEGLFLTSNPVLVKEALNLTGVPVGSVRLPLVPASQEHRDTLQSILQDL